MLFNNKNKGAFAAVLVGAGLLLGCKPEKSNNDDSSQAPLPSPAPSPSQPSAGGLQSSYCSSNFIRLVVENGQYTLLVPELGNSPIAMTGTFANSVLQLTGEFQGHQLMYLGAATDDGLYMSTNIMLMENGMPRHSIKSLAKAGTCPTMNVEALPKISENPVNLADIRKISRFRSSAGHNYSDPSESCRSMKHYFEPVSSVAQSTEVKAPFRAMVIGVYNDDGPMGDNQINNQHIVLQPIDYPAVQLAIFHTELAGSLMIGSVVEQGALLGWADLSRGGGTASDFDFAVHVNTDSGLKAVSLFTMLSDSAFAEFAVWSGLGTREDFMISKSDRDANPLQCVAGALSTFSGEFENRDADNLSNLRWVSGL